MDNEEVIKKWVKSANDDLFSAEDMMLHSHYDWALLIGQLVLEKNLKGLYFKKTKTQPPSIHDLVKLGKLCDIQLSQEQSEELAEITTYHINARYGEIKFELYKKANTEYAKLWFDKVKEYSSWFKSLY